MNKFLILIAAFLFASQISNAQTEKGNQTIGVDAGFTYNNSNNYVINPADNSSSTLNSKTTSFNIGPNYSYFIADKLDIGASLSYSSSTLNNGTNGDPSKLNSYSYGGIVYLRKYFMYHDKIGIRVGPYAGYSRGDNKATYGGTSSIYDNDTKSDDYNVGGSLALVYYPSKRLGVSATIASLDYSHFKEDSGALGHVDGDSVNFNFVNNGVSLSLFYTFGNK